MAPKTHHSSPLPIDADTLNSLARRRGDCLTVLLPPARPGTHDGDRLPTLHSLYHALLPREDASLRVKVEAALAEEHLRGGGTGLAIFAGASFMEIHSAPVEAARIVEGPYCFILPLLRHVGAPQDFLILGLSQKELRLLHYLQGEVSPIDLPPETPANVAEFHHPEAHGDQHRENRSSAGTSGSGTIRFGTQAEREDAHATLERLFVQLDHRLAPLLGQRSLLLMGLDEEVAAFRRVAKHCKLFPGHVAHGMRDLPLREIAQQARECAQQQRQAEGRAALLKFREWGDRSQAIDDPAAVIAAAREGRVHVLCVPEAFETPSDEEALCNAAVAETLSHGGDVFAVPSEELEPWQKLPAILRY